MSVQPPLPGMFEDPKLGAQIREFKTKVEGVMVHHPELVATSWFRDPMENARVGGDIYSQHQVGLAIDLDWIGADLDYYKQAAQRGLAMGLSSVVYWTGSKHYLHFQLLPGPYKTDEPFGMLYRPSSGTWYVDLALIIWDRLRPDEPTMTVKLE